MIDGLTDGIWLMNNGDIPAQTIDETAFGILQAARLAEFMKGEKKSIQMTKDFDAFKNFLMNE